MSNGSLERTDPNDMEQYIGYLTNNYKELDLDLVEQQQAMMTNHISIIPLVESEGKVFDELRNLEEQAKIDQVVDVKEKWTNAS